MQRHHPSFSITETLLSGLALAAACSAAIYAGKCWYDGATGDALQSTGITLWLAATIRNPLNGWFDGLTFPWRVLERSGRESLIDSLLNGLALVFAVVGVAWQRWW